MVKVQFGNAPTQGLVIRGGVLQSLDMTVNSNITVAKQVVSGDAMSSLTLSGTGRYEWIALRLVRNETRPLTGSLFTEVADYVRAEVYCHYPVFVSGGMTASGAIATVQQRVNDFKTTVLSGVWSSGNPAVPKLVAEEHPMAHQQVAKGSLTYRLRYVL